MGSKLVEMLFIRGNIAFICIPLAKALSHGSLLEGRCHLLPGWPRALLEDQVLLQRGTRAQKVGDRQEPGPRQPFLLPLKGRSPFPGENLSFSTLRLWVWVCSLELSDPE